MIYAPVFMPPYYPSSYPRKKNNYFLSTSHLVYPFQKSVVLLTSASAYYVDNTMQYQKKEKTHRQRYGLTCIFKNDKNTDERCHHRRNVGKNWYEYKSRI